MIYVDDSKFSKESKPHIKNKHKKSEINTNVKQILLDLNFNKFISVFEINTEGAPIDIEKSILNALEKGKVYCLR